MAIGDVLYHTKICENSMEWAKSVIGTVPHGSLFMADLHQSPRGRQGRVWQSASGQLLLTFVLKPDLLPQTFANLFMALCLGFLRPLVPYGIKLKWPNDLVVGHKKIAGILMELVWQGKNLEGIVLGAGFNVNNTFEPTNPLYGKATSLYEVTGKYYDLECLRKEFCTSLEVLYQEWISGNEQAIYDEWRQFQAYQGVTIRIHAKDGKNVTGVMHDVLSNGDLHLLDRDGHSNIIAFHDVDNITDY